MNLLMFNLAVDAEHVTLAFGLRWIEALSQRFDHIDVVTMYEGKHDLPANVIVWSVGRERGYPKWFRALRFYWLTYQVLRQRRPAVVFSHMIPLFSVLFFPVAWFKKLPSVLWYAHGATPRMLRLAHRVVDRVVTSTPQGFRLQTSKMTVIGQGIDTVLFKYQPRKRGLIFHLVTVGRLAPSKGQDILLSALQNWQPSDGRPWKLTIVGDATSDSEHEFAARVRQQALSVRLPDEVVFTGRLDPKDIAHHLAQADVFVNLGTTGSLDKAIVEAMACGCTVVSCNDAFAAMATANGFSNCIVENTEQSLREGLDRFVVMSDRDRVAIAERQAHVANTEHALDGLIARLAAVLQDSAAKA